MFSWSLWASKSWLSVLCHPSRSSSADSYLWSSPAICPLMHPQTCSGNHRKRAQNICRWLEVVQTTVRQSYRPWSFQAKSNCRRWRIGCLSSNFCMYHTYNTYTTCIHIYSTFSWCADLQRIPRRAHQAKIHSFCAKFLKNSDFYYL